MSIAIERATRIGITFLCALDCALQDGNQEGIDRGQRSPRRQMRARRAHRCWPEPRIDRWIGGVADR
jgi:hypothetical protein